MNTKELFNSNVQPANPLSEFQLVKRKTTNRYLEELQAAADKRDEISALLAIENLCTYVLGLPMRTEPWQHFNLSLEYYSKAVWGQQPEDAKKYLQQIQGLIAAVPDPNAQTARFKPWKEPGTFEVNVVGVYGHVNRQGMLLMNNVVEDSKGDFFGVPYGIEFEDKPIPVALHVTERQHPKFGKLLLLSMVRR